MEENNNQISDIISNQENLSQKNSLVKIKEKIKLKINIKILVLVLATILFAILIFFGGLYVGVRTSQPVRDRLVSEKIIPERYKDADFNRIWKALDVLKSKYIGDIDYNKIIDGAIAGMVAGLEDPFTAYFNKDNLEAFNGEINGTFEGIGAEVSYRDDKLVVVAPIEGAPAQKAGLKAGDIIKAIDNYPVAGLIIDEAILRMRGKKGTDVTLSIQRGEEAMDIKITRDVINVKSVNSKDLGEGITYIRILRFDGDTSALFNSAAEQIVKNNAKGLILDLRNNPGGYLDSAIQVSSQFIKDGVVVIEEYKDKSRKEMRNIGGGKLFDIPVVILVNGGSASGSEILAGALRDNKRGILIGEKTFGKGSVQELTPLDSGGALKITMAKWLTPNGTVIDKNGLLPDIELKWEENIDVNKDNQLEKAIEELKKIIK